MLGCNVAFIDWPWIDAVYIGDQPCLLRLLPDLERWHSAVPDRLIMSKHPGLTPTAPWIHHFTHSPHLAGIDTRPGQICGNRSTGGGAINVAVQLGATRIVLLGYDMCANPHVQDGEPHRCNYHDRHSPRARYARPQDMPSLVQAKQQRRRHVPPPPPATRGADRFATFSRPFVEIAAALQKLRVNVYTCTEGTSALTVFPRITFAEALEMA